MKKKQIRIGILLAVILVSCAGQKSTTSQHQESTAKTAENTNHQHSDYFGAYNLEDEIFGTKTTVTLSGDKRIMVTNSLPNHKVGSFPNEGNPNTISAQNKTYTFPVNPVYTGKSNWIRQPGVALNGVKFEPGTAEVVICDTGENYRVEAFQDLINLGLDFNHAHVQPTGAYHYHGSPTSVIENLDTGEDLVHIGFAQDGFPIYFSKSEVYKPSYKLVDGNREGEECTYENPHNKMDISMEGHHNGTFTSDFEFVEGSGDLDECNGTTIDGKYGYVVTKTFPYVSRCLMGVFEQEERNGPQRGGQGKRPNVAQVLEQMDTDKDGKLSKNEVKGPLEQDFSRIDTNKDGFISKSELEKAANGNKQPQRRGPRN